MNITEEQAPLMKRALLDNIEKKKNFMAFPDEPEKGGSKDGNHMEKEESWYEVTSKCKIPPNRGKGWGKGFAVHGNDAQFHVQSQGLERKSTVHEFFKDNKMHVLPVIVCSLDGSIAPMHNISNCCDKSFICE